MNSDDKQLAGRVLKGDGEALRAFFDRYYAPTYRFCLRRTSREDAEELATDALRHAIRRLGTYRGEARLMTWIYGIARNLLATHVRRSRKHRNLVFIDDNERVRAEIEAMARDSGASPEDAHELWERQNRVHMMLDYLPADYARILEWKYIDGLSVNEIAVRLKTTEIAVQSRLARARRACRNSMANLSEELAHPRNSERIAGGERK